MVNKPHLFSFYRLSAMGNLDLRVLFLAHIIFILVPVRSYDSWCSGEYCFSSDWNDYRPATLTEAQAICKNQSQSSWLLEIYNKTVQELVMTFLEKYKQDLYDRDILLGLKRYDINWTWADGKDYEGTFSSSNLKMRIITVSVPFGTLRYLNLDIIVDPSSMVTTSKLVSRICSFTRDCDNNNTHSVKVNDICYEFYKDGIPMNWFQAQRFCTEKGGTLAVLSDKNFPSDIQERLRKLALPLENYWIGLFNSYWGWIHGTDNVSNFTMWYSGYPMHPYLKVAPDSVFTDFKFVDGGIWMDSNDQTKKRVIVCMNTSGIPSNKTGSNTAATIGSSSSFPLILVMGLLLLLYCYIG